MAFVSHFLLSHRLVLGPLSSPITILYSSRVLSVPHNYKDKAAEHTQKKDRDTHRVDQIVQRPQHPGRDMLPRHAGHFERRPFPLTPLGGLDVDEHVLEEVQVVDGGEGFVGAFGVGEVGFGVGSGDDGEIAPEGGFDFLVEVVAGEGVSGLQAVERKRGRGRGERGGRSIGRREQGWRASIAGEIS